MYALTYKEVFPLVQGNQVWYGPSISSGDREFGVPDAYPLKAAGCRIDEHGKKFIQVKGVRWFTNIEHGRRHDPLPLMTMEDNRRFNKKLKKTDIAYKQYSNYDAIEVPYTNAIPSDYSGLMGVPISFLDKYSPEQFEILGNSRTLGVPISEVAEKGTYSQGGPRFYVGNGDGTHRRLYDRIVIRNRALS